MPVASPFLVKIGSALGARLATPSRPLQGRRHRGFLVAAVGFTTIVVNDQDSIADTAWGLGSLFGMEEPAAPAPQQSQPAPSRGWGWLAPRRHAHGEAHREASRHRVARVESARFIRSVEHVHSISSTDGPVELGRRSVCVRLCDGFAFPVGAYHGDEDRARSRGDLPFRVPRRRHRALRRAIGLGHDGRGGPCRHRQELFGPSLRVPLHDGAVERVLVPPARGQPDQVSAARLHTAPRRCGDDEGRLQGVPRRSALPLQAHRLRQARAEPRHPQGRPRNLPRDRAGRA